MLPPYSSPIFRDQTVHSYILMALELRVRLLKDLSTAFLEITLTGISCEVIVSYKSV